ncbi:MAG: hypothetical protein SNJ77_11235 [Cytophagales bacterium]
MKKKIVFGGLMALMFVAFSLVALKNLSAAQFCMATQTCSNGAFIGCVGEKSCFGGSGWVRCDGVDITCTPA